MLMNSNINMDAKEIWLRAHELVISQLNRGLPSNPRNIIQSSTKSSRPETSGWEQRYEYDRGSQSSHLMADMDVDVEEAGAAAKTTPTMR